MRAADRGDVTVLAERLRLVNQELSLLRNWQRRAAEDQGFVAMPRAFFDDLESIDPNEAVMYREEARVAQLKQEIEIEREKLAQRRESEQRPLAVRETQSSSLAAKAAVEVQLEIPVPPATPVSRTDEVLAGADYEGMGRARFRNRDWAGALLAFERVPEADRDASVLYRMAYCHDLLEKWDEAEKGYRLVLDKAAEGHWRKSAEYQLGLLGQKKKLREMLGAVGAGKSAQGGGR